MSEDIEIIKKHYVFTTKHVLDDENKQFKQAIENLINKNKEQEKIIKLMAEYISGTDKDEDICKKVGQKQLCDEYGENSKCKECVIEYYKNKAKELK